MPSQVSLSPYKESRADGQVEEESVHGSQRRMRCDGDEEQARDDQ